MSNIEDILSIQKQFYDELYAQNSDVEFTLDHEMVKANSEWETNKEIQIQIGELDNAIKTMARNKSPGPDGLTTEFYQTFWDLLLFIFCSYSMFPESTAISYSSGGGSKFDSQS